MYYLITRIKFSLSFLELFSLLGEIYILIQCFLVDMAKLLELLIAPMKHFMQFLDTSSLVPTISNIREDIISLSVKTLENKIKKVKPQTFLKKNIK